MLNGMINIYKEPGFSSHDVVAKLRGMLKQKKIGHTGTLDPMAEGVLPVCLGNACKLCDMITDHEKIYEAELLLGTSTDTEDVTGTVLRTEKVVCSEKEVRAAVLSFVGDYLQIPPMYSAIWVNGRRLYELAREGVVIEREPRPVTVHEIEILKIELPVVHLRIHCSKGTYIRSLCRDIGDKLGCGGCMQRLVRTKVGIFTADGALRLEEIQRRVDREEGVEDLVIPSDQMFPELAQVVVSPEDDFLAGNGNPVKLSCRYSRIRLYLSDHTFLGVYAYRPEYDRYYVEKMFYQQPSTFSK